MTNQINEQYLAQNKGPWLYGIFCSVLGISLVFAGLRFYCRLRYLKIFQSSDYFALIAIIMTCAMSAAIHGQIKTGMGRHIEYSEMHPGMLEKSMKFGYAENILYQASVGVVKSSILAQYYRIATTRTQRIVVICVWAFTAVFCVFVTLSAILQCIPISAIFNPNTFPKGCWNMMVMNLITSGVNITVDCVIFILPLPVLFKLRLQRRKKIILLATYLLGSMSIFASALRVSSMILWTGETDYTYVSAIIPIYDAVEINTGIICACLPLLRPLLRNVAESRSTVYSTQEMWFSPRSRSVGNNVDEVPLTQVVSDVNHLLLPLSPLLVSGSTTPRSTMRSTEQFSVC